MPHSLPSSVTTKLSRCIFGLSIVQYLGGSIVLTREGGETTKFLSIQIRRQNAYLPKHRRELHNLYHNAHPAIGETEQYIFDLDLEGDRKKNDMSSSLHEYRCQPWAKNSASRSKLHNDRRKNLILVGSSCRMSRRHFCVMKHWLLWWHNQVKRKGKKGDLDLYHSYLDVNNADWS